jgi:hypothetical protein
MSIPSPDPAKYPSVFIFCWARFVTCFPSPPGCLRQHSVDQQYVCRSAHRTARSSSVKPKLHNRPLCWSQTPPTPVKRPSRPQPLSAAKSLWNRLRSLDCMKKDRLRKNRAERGRLRWVRA